MGPRLTVFRRLGRMLALVFAVTSIAGQAMACRMNVSNFVGWQIVYAGELTGYVTDDGFLRHRFEGCEIGRILVVDGDREITCGEYRIGQGENLDIVVLYDGRQTVACIDNRVYKLRL